MTPKTKIENLLIWVAAVFLALLLSFLGSWVEQASSIPPEQSINWRSIWIDVVQSLLYLAPIVGAGLGLPRLGKEQIASMVSDLGKEEAVARLETPVLTPEEVRNTIVGGTNIDLNALAVEILLENRKQEIAKRFPNGPIPEQIR